MKYAKAIGLVGVGAGLLLAVSSPNKTPAEEQRAPSGPRPKASIIRGVKSGKWALLRPGFSGKTDKIDLSMFYNTKEEAITAADLYGWDYRIVEQKVPADATPEQIKKGPSNVAYLITPEKKGQYFFEVFIPGIETRGYFNTRKEAEEYATRKGWMLVEK